MGYRSVVMGAFTALGLMAGLPAAMAQDAAPNPQAILAATPGARLAGYLNFCIGNGLAQHDEATPLLVALIEKTNAVPPDEKGNMDYAYGTAGVLHPGTPERARLTDLDIPQRRDLCARAVQKAGMGA
ncbi:hypothetical protein HNW77_02075 [Komagataeibacter sp. AV436]|uniref:Alcohol dehydrogenase n=1 Tax=Komagataeibacter melomenusus TaxID=2766578 RepID=A0ABX2ABI9_9PROT|nr:hypothetical protein [Komagataeibacter melomenusus]MBV1829481.1 hypothetical protein [Komagataeibacter melomenusus]NPC65212.1 hypothetical protein [Komagataeibacter melomenusus]